MSSGLKGLFGRLLGGGPERENGDAAAADEATEYKGFDIHPAPRKQGSAWLLAGTITKELPDGIREHTFIRADTFAARDEAVTYTIRKGRQLIDERGDRLFDGG